MTASRSGFPRNVVLLSALAALAACAGGPDPEAAGPSHMYAHYSQVGEIHSAVVDGSVDATRGPARWLATHQGDELPEAGQPSLETMRNEARIIAAQRDLAEIGRSLARMGAACGSCHTALGQGPDITVAEPPPTSNVPSEHMKRHAWGADRMWEGLIGPSGSAWAAGAGALGSLPLDFGSNDQASRLAKLVHDLAGKAADARGPKDRAAVYGEVLETCSLCHSALNMRMR